MNKILMFLSIITFCFYISGCVSTSNNNSSDSVNSETTGFNAECRAECMNKSANSSCSQINQLPQRITAPKLVQIVRFWCPNTASKYGI